MKRAPIYRALAIAVLWLTFGLGCARAATTVRLISMQEGNPEVRRALILIHGTWSDAGDWADFLRWWINQPTLRQMYSLYTLQYGVTYGQSVTNHTSFEAASDTARDFYDKIMGNRSQPDNFDRLNPSVDPSRKWLRVASWQQLDDYGKALVDEAGSKAVQNVDLRMGHDNALYVPPLDGGYREVMLLGHSQGGLVAKELAVKPDNPLNIAKVIYMCTPHDGAAAAAALQVLEPSMQGSLWSDADLILNRGFRNGQSIALDHLSAGLLFMADLRDPNGCGRYHPGFNSWKKFYAQIGEKKIDEYTIYGKWDINLRNLGSQKLWGLGRLTGGTSASDGVVTTNSARGFQNGPRVPGDGKNPLDIAKILDSLVRWFLYETATVTDTPWLHTHMSHEFKAFENARVFLGQSTANHMTGTPGNLSYQEVDDRRKLVEHLYYSQLGRSARAATGPGVDDLTPDEWASWFKSDPPPYSDNYRYSDVEGQYTAMWVLKDDAGAPMSEAGMRAWMNDSLERQQKVAALYRAIKGSEPEPGTVSFLQHLDESMAQLAARIQGLPAPTPLPSSSP